MIDRQHVIQSRTNIEAERVSYALEHMAQNAAYRHAAARAGGDVDGQLLEQFRQRYRWYRSQWRGQPRQAIEEQRHHERFAEVGAVPLCVDIETVAFCDLACPFCYRQSIATPDKLMSESLFYRLVDQCAELGVPSIKLNWRGEPLLHPKLPELIAYAKRAGILETWINTNAVTLTEDKARALIAAGVDIVTYSFDGGTKATYEQMRVGRFRENTFEAVYGKIRRMAELKRELSAAFPRTQIQMVLTEQTFGEQEEFFALFRDCVDDVAVKAYTERGGSLPDLDAQTQQAIERFRQAHQLPRNSAYWRDMSGALFLSAGRLPCEQPFQRLMVTYDGRVSMCCYDWGSEYPVGYVDPQAYERGDRDYEEVMAQAQRGAKGFELLQRVQMPRRYVDPPKRVNTLAEIWHGVLINDVRQRHIEGHMETVPVCTGCPFKETYRWVKVDAA